MTSLNTNPNLPSDRDILESLRRDAADCRSRAGARAHSSQGIQIDPDALDAIIKKQEKRFKSQDDSKADGLIKANGGAFVLRGAKGSLDLMMKLIKAFMDLLKWLKAILFGRRPTKAEKDEHEAGEAQPHARHRDADHPQEDETEPASPEAVHHGEAAITKLFAQTISLATVLINRLSEEGGKEEVGDLLDTMHSPELLLLVSEMVEKLRSHTQARLHELHSLTAGHAEAVAKFAHSNRMHPSTVQTMLETNPKMLSSLGGGKELISQYSQTLKDADIVQQIDAAMSDVYSDLRDLASPYSELHHLFPGLNEHKFIASHSEDKGFSAAHVRHILVVENEIHSEDDDIGSPSRPAFS